MTSALPVLKQRHAMRTRKLSRFLTLLATFGLVFTSFQASPEDIDIFSVDQDSTVNNPNVLFIIDNSANWSRQSQQWPGGEDQGQSEVDAIKTEIGRASCRERSKKQGD